MKKNALYLVLMLLLMTPFTEAKEVKGVNIPDSYMAGKTKLVLNGTGIRSKFFQSLYVGGLYLQKKSSDAKAIMDADEPMVIKMHVISGLITSDKMVDAFNDGFEKATNDNTKPIANEIKQFLGTFKRMNVNDVYDYVYIPGTGVQVYKNKSLKATVKGLAFKKALFGIWLCDDPADEKLKKGMLGK